jgi:exonuclease SbcD
MRALHTSDWHLGHTLKEVNREYEHRAFLQWLLATLQSEQPDLLLISGDVFDTATPSATAEQMWFGFLAAARRQHPVMDIVVIAGNHDSPSRLAAPAPVLRELNVSIVATVPRGADLQPQWQQLIVPVCGGRALVAAVPFLRAHDLAHFTEEELASGQRDVAMAYRRVKTAVRAVRQPTQPLFVMGHLYAAGGVTDSKSERPIAVGGQDSAPPSMFPKEASYVALGHLHRGQKVYAEHVRYAGAPIPLAIEEANYHHHVVAIDVDDATLLASIRQLPIPRAVDIIRIPKRGWGSVDSVLATITALPDEVAGAAEALQPPPFVEVCVELDAPEPKLRAKIEAALVGKAVRLIHIDRRNAGTGETLQATANLRSLEQLTPIDVFEQLWRRNYGSEPSAEIRAAFAALHAEAAAATVLAVDEAAPEATPGPSKVAP